MIDKRCSNTFYGNWENAKELILDGWNMKLCLNHNLADRLKDQNSEL